MPSKIMIVDDDYTMNSLLKILLEMDGFEVFVSPMPDMVLPNIRQEKPDALLMDVHIGEVNGITILRNIRADADPLLQNLPIVIQSGLDVEDRCKAAGASAFILKPYPPDQLSSTLKKVLS